MTERLALPLYKVTIRPEVTTKAKKPTPIGYAVCDFSGQYITQSLTEGECDDLVAICNKHFDTEAKGIRQLEYTKLICYLNVEIDPIEKPDKQIIGTSVKGNNIICDTPEYTKYLESFADAVARTNKPIRHKLPIDCKCQLSASFYCSSREGKCISAYMEALLDALVTAGILKNKTHKVVNNIDGSRIYFDAKQPHVNIFIRYWGLRK
jgi:hypothetical protein